jgi:arabinogalactan oligomer/maltooligosaccharide transport system permease protein
MGRKFKLKDVALMVLMTFMAVIVVLILLYPVKYIIVLSFTPFTTIHSLTSKNVIDGLNALQLAVYGDVRQKTLFLLNEIFLIPVKDTQYLTLSTYQEVLDPSIIRSIMNSLIIAVTVLALNITFIPAAAFALSRFRFIGRGTLLYSYLLLSQVAGGFGIAILVSLYIMLTRYSRFVGIQGTPAMLILLGAVYFSGSVPFNTWLMKNFYDNIPRDIEEAAFIDGAGFWTLLFRIIIPMAKPSLVILSIFGFMAGWGEFLLANWVLGGAQSSLAPLAVKVFNETLKPVPDWNRFAALVIIYAIPLILLFVFAQKYLGEAFRVGAVKG